MSGEHRKWMLSLIHRSKHQGTMDASLWRQIEAERSVLEKCIEPCGCCG